MSEQNKSYFSEETTTDQLILYLKTLTGDQARDVPSLPKLCESAILCGNKKVNLFSYEPCKAVVNKM